jgi:Transposase and inactivated derivatives
MNDTHSLAHTRWSCKYHVVFAPKYRRQVFYDEKRIEIGAILRELCRWKGITILEAEVCVDHVHMLLEIPPKMSVSGVMGFLKGKSSLMIYERWGNMKYKYRNRQFWCRGYYVDTTGKNTKKIQEYIANQMKEDKIAEQLTLEGVDPFTGSRK